jgi:hypothetical protein
MTSRALLITPCVVALGLVAGCGDGNAETMRQLGSSKADSSQPTSSAVSVHSIKRAATLDSLSRPASQKRIRVRER